MDAVVTADHVSHLALVAVAGLLYALAAQIARQTWLRGITGDERIGLLSFAVIFFLAATCGLSAVVPLPVWTREILYWLLVAVANFAVWTGQARVIALLLRRD